MEIPAEVGHPAPLARFPPWHAVLLPSHYTCLHAANIDLIGLIEDRSFNRIIPFAFQPFLSPQPMTFPVSLGHRPRGYPAQSRQNSEALSLALGFSLGSALVVGGLGLRWPVLLSAVVPPLAAGSFWQRRRSRAPNSFLANSASETNSLLEASLLEARGLQNRLNQLCGNGAKNAIWRLRWEGLATQMEAIRSQAARCIELEPQAAVPLLVCMEELLDRIETVGRMMQQLELHAPSPLSGSYGLVNRRMEELQNHLSSHIRRLQEIHDSALEQSMLHPGEPIDFQHLLTKAS
jgi:hypothetical protein